MKLTTFLLIIALVQASAAGYSQVTLKAKNAPLKDVLNTLKKQTGYTFFYDQDDVDPVKINVQVSNASLKDALDKCLQDQQLTYEIKENTVFISKKEPTLLDNLKDKVKELLANIDVRGRVVDEEGQPLPGATVTVKGGNNVTTTDANGYFRLSNVDPAALLTVSFIGFDKQDIKAAAELGEIKMHKATSKLDEVQVIAYGQQTERLSVGNVAKINSKTIEQQPVSNIMSALKGQVSGLFITQANGLPGGGITSRIQGQNSLLYGNDPFIVVDGVPYPSQSLATSSGGPLGASGGPAGSGTANTLSFLNVDDVESVTVLKDADATAIYGSRAANGAILITTKKGKAGDTKVDVNIQNGFGKISHFLDLMNTGQYLAMRAQAKSLDGSAILSTDYDLNGLWDQTSNTNWQKALLGGTAQYSDYNANISGGSEITQYYIGGTFHRETTVFPGDYADKKGALHFNLTSASNNKKLKLLLSGSYLLDNNLLPNSDFTGKALQLIPDAPSLFNSDGTINWAPNSSGASSWTNPIASTTAYQLKTSNLIGNANLSYEILPSLKLATNFGYSRLELDQYQPSPLTSVKPENRATTSRGATYSNSTMSTWIIEPQLTYTKSLGKSKINGLLGGTIQQTDNNGQSFFASGFNSDTSLPDIHSAATVQSTNSVISTYKYAAVFGRITYNYQEKYLLDLNVRRDATSRFGPANQFHDFGSIGAGYIFNEENFVKQSLSFLSFGKLRVSYGTTGSDQIPNYLFLNLYKPVTAAVPYQGVAGLGINGQFANPYIQWEETKKFQAGIDLGFFDNRVLAYVTYSNNHSSNELLNYQLPIITGFASISENFPATVQNEDWEFTVNTTNIKYKDFSWQTSANLTIPENKLIAFPSLASSTYANQLVVGQPLSVQKLYQFAGVNSTTGVYQFMSSQGNLTSNPDGIADKTAFGNLLPHFYGGVTNDIHLKNFELSFTFLFVKQTALNPLVFGGSIQPGNISAAYGNMPAVLYGQQWQKSGDVASIQRLSANSTYLLPYFDAEQSTGALTDASFIRLKTLSFSWNLSENWMRTAHVNSCTVFVQGQNLLTFTKYLGLDPETQTVTGLPPLRVLTTGVRLQL